MNGHFISTWFRAGLGATLSLILAQSSWAAPVMESLPPSSAQYGLIKTQRLRFKNAPLLKQAHAAVARRDDLAAARLFNDILGNDPGNNPAKLALITLYERLDRREDGIRLCDELIRQYPDFIDPYFSKAYLARQSGKYDLAVAAWQAGLNKAPPDFPRRREILRDLGQAYTHLARYADAANAYAQALAQAFEINAALEYFYVLKALKTPEKGQALLERILAGSPPASLKTEALYELAQLDRRAGQMPEYFQHMEILVREDTDARRLQDYGLQLYDAGHRDLALAAATKQFDLEKDPRQKLELGLFIAQLYIEQRRPDAAREWLKKITSFAGADIRWPLTMARADFVAEDYRACCDRLMALKQRPATATLLLGFAFLKRNMPGAALEFFNEIDNPDILSASEQLSLFRNRAYLNFDQNQFPAAYSDAEAALALAPTANMALVRLKALAMTSVTNDIEKAGDRLLNPGASGLRLAAAEQAQVLLVIGRHLYRKEHYEPALQRLTDAAKLDPTLAEAYYLRGLADHALGKAKEALTNYHEYVRLEPNPPATFWGDLGQAEGKDRQYKNGTAALQRSLEYHSVDVATLSDQSYQFMKWAFPDRGADHDVIFSRWNHNQEAKQSLRRAIDLYADLVPRVPTNETAAYRNREVAMKQEYTKLDRVIGIQGYVSRTDYGFPTNVGISSVDGALPSQGGLELSLRPPIAGFLNERTLDVFGTILGNFERRSWTPDSDSYQGLVGLRLKPFIRGNYNMSFARLFKIGDNAEDNWLWRNMASWEHGEKPAPGKSVGLNLKLFGDVGYYFDPRARWYGYLDGRVGPSWQIHQNALLTFPQAMGILRYESNDAGDTGSYGLAGIGATLRLFEPERRHTINRIYADIFIDYTWGRFMSTPGGFDGRSFEGAIIGISLVK